MAHRLSRRALLASLASSAVLLPILRARPLVAQTRPSSTRPKRLLMIFNAEGMLQSDWWPAGNGGALDRITLPYCTRPLAAISDKVIMVDNLEYTSAYDDPLVHGGHDAELHMLTGIRSLPGGVSGGQQASAGAGGISVDQYIASRIAATTPLPFRSLDLGVTIQLPTLQQSRWSYTGPGQPVTPEQDPAAVLRDVFGVGVDPAARAQLNAEQRLALETVDTDLQSYAAALASNDQSQIQTHRAAVQQLAARLDPALATACAAPDLGGAVPPYADINQFPAIAMAHAKLIARAFACDLTRVATLQLGDAANNNLRFTWLDGPPVDGIGLTPGDSFANYEHHQIAHAAGGGGPGQMPDIKRRVDRWFVDLFTQIVQVFASTPDADGGSLLDQTAIVMMNNMSNGAGHHMGRAAGGLPTLIAGSCGGYFALGQHVKTSVASVPHNRLLTSLCHAMDCPPDGDYFGDMRYGVGPLPGLAA